MFQRKQDGRQRILGDGLAVGDLGGGHDNAAIDRAVGSLLPGVRSPLVVYNKSDLVRSLPANVPAGISTSALTGAGLPELLEAIAQRLVPEPPGSGVGVPFTAAHCAAIDEASAALADDDPRRAHAALECLLAAPASRPS